jgi:phage terminase large subunit-like protein
VTVPKKKTTIELSPERQLRRELAEASLLEFIALVHPKRLLGNIHREVISWWTTDNASRYQLLLLPRDHMKSALIAYRVVWELTKDPTLKILYISSTSNLAIKQLKFMKDILTCDAYRMYWPEMVNKDEAKREKWTEREISVDHPKRKEENVRDPSIFTAGLTSNIVGLHCDISVLDDVVATNNAYLAEGREKVTDQYSHLSSVEGTNAREWVVGTRYHPKDLYATLMEMTVEEYDDNGEVIDRKPMYEVREWAVENAGDGTGEFIWPRQQRSDGKWFGFDRKILADKRNQYQNALHFRAQYYNDPHDVDSSPIQRDLFQYYDQNYLSKREGKWYFKRDKLNLVAAVDFAYSTSKKADYSAIVVVGLDGNQNYYVLDIDRFRTGAVSEYYKHILALFEHWGFRRIRAEVSAAQAVIVKDLKDNYIRPNGLSLIVDEYKPSRWTGSKEERIMTTLEPKYANRQIWHYPAGNCQVLEEELLFANPAHDDVKDALASAIDFVTAPTLSMINTTTQTNFSYHGKFGGVI